MKYPTLQELVEVVLVEVDPLHVVEVPDAVRHSVLRDDDGEGGTVLRTDPVDHLAEGEGGHVQPARPGLVPGRVLCGKISYLWVNKS